MTRRLPENGSGELVSFVRETLGCGCPDEVLARIRVGRGVDGAPCLDVGGRLMVAVIPYEDLDRLIDSFPDTVERSRRERDLRGFNRVRMVVVHASPEVLGETLDDMLHTITAADDRVHVHVLPPDVVPEVLIVSD